MIERVCEICGATFKVKPYRVRRGQGRFCSIKCFAKCPDSLARTRAAGKYERTPDHRQKSRETAKINFGGPRTPEHNRKIGLANKGNKRPDLKALSHRRWEAGLYDGPNNPNFGNHWTPEMRENGRLKRLAYVDRTPIEQRRLSAQTKAKLSAIRKQQWQDPQYVAKLIKAMALSPNKLENRVISILVKNIPEYGYNGDFRMGIMLGGLVPDFVNTNGRKKVLEILGDYWHSPEIVKGDVRRTEEGKLAVYRSVGWDCLPIWEHELRQLTDDQIVTKIREFTNKEAVHACD